MIRYMGVMKNRQTHLIASILLALPGVAFSQVRVPDFDAVTRLAKGAIAGTNVDTPVPGFELKLLVNGERAYHRAFGLWSLDKVAKIDSSSKTMSGAVIASLLDSASVPFTLDSKLSSFLPSFGAADRRNITIRQAFSHSSGLPGDAGSTNLGSITLQQCAALIGNNAEMVNGPPGSTFFYGGASMQCAGAAAEVAGGDTFANLLATRILNPLGLTNTRFYFPSQTNPLVAGGLESTASEFGTFMEMLRKGGVHNGVQVISAASAQKMLTRQTASDINIAYSPSAGSADYGIGIWLDQRDANGNLQSALAAGARGFSSWIDQDDPITGVLGTDTTSAQNVLSLGRAGRDAAQAAVRNLALAGDTNRDEDVDFDDLLVLAQNYSKSDRLFAQGDFTGDGITNFDDLLLLSQNYGMGGSVRANLFSDWQAARSMVPEPVFCSFVAIFAISTRKRRLR